MKIICGKIFQTTPTSDFKMVETQAEITTTIIIITITIRGTTIITMEYTSTVTVVNRIKKKIQ